VFCLLVVSGFSPNKRRIIISPKFKVHSSEFKVPDTSFLL
jgi:hypothetical protein